MKTVDLTGLKLISLADIEAAGRDGVSEMVVCGRAVVTPSARDRALQKGIALRSNGAQKAGVATTDRTGPRVGATDSALKKLFNSAEAEAIKAEIVNVGRKLWNRMYVDGNGGNISYRIGPNEVICTPTLISKADLKPEDLCLVDLDGKQLIGQRPRTSEILLHLEIYKAVPEAKGVVHCHPPHATAYAITGHVPPTCIIPECEVFVGQVAISPYETPGTKKFAETVLPYVKKHNTILLANHGIVCWADTVTHAEWYAEVLDTYCWTLMLASQIGPPITYIPDQKTADLLRIKKSLGLPDARHDPRECRLCDLPELQGGIAVRPGAQSCTVAGEQTGGADVDHIVRSVTDAVMAALAKQSS